jgi:hypothetical protein
MESCAIILTRVLNYGNNDVDLDNGQVGGQGH